MHFPPHPPQRSRQYHLKKTGCLCHTLLNTYKKETSVNFVKMPAKGYTPLAVVSCARKTLHVSTTATIAQIPAVSSKEGTEIGAVLSTRKFHH
jgi:hypothetical protein